MNDKDREPKIHPTAEVGEDVELGDWTTVHKHVEIGGKVKIGRAGWILPFSVIGGGQKELGSLDAGDFFHLGRNGFVNIAHEVSIGNEVGFGTGTKLYTHGGYLSVWECFPYQEGPIIIGDNVWLPYAIVLPNVTIGNDVVVSAMSLVNKNIPSGSLYGGVPAKVLRRDGNWGRIGYSDGDGDEVWFPTEFNRNGVLNSIMTAYDNYGAGADIKVEDSVILRVDKTKFFVSTRRIDGPVTKDTELVRNLFRRIGIRFQYYDNGGEYTPWD